MPKEKIPVLHQQVLEAMAALPGVQAVARPMIRSWQIPGTADNVTVEGYNPPPDEDFDVEEPSVNAGFFHAMQVPLLAGRTFSEDDDATHPPVVIVNESFVKHYFSSPAAAVGQTRGSGRRAINLEYMTIVGVARDAKHTDLREPALPTLFTPLRQAKVRGPALSLSPHGDPARADLRYGPAGDEADRSGACRGRDADDGRSD